MRRLYYPGLVSPPECALSQPFSMSLPMQARGLAQNIAVMERGKIVLSGTRGEIDEDDVRRRLSV